ncbi:MAG: hypothetical protein KDB53_02875 [Planctomycetes bacterium]|nr:hypothetical protein [Planctomycetota bacterium]
MAGIHVRRREEARRAPLIAVLAGLVVLSAALAVPAQGSTQGNSPQDINDSRVTLRVTDQPLEDVIKYIREKSRVNIIFGPDVVLDTRVTVDLELVPWREALKIVADRTGCVIVKKAENLFVVEQPARITWKFQQSPITSVIEAIAKISGTSIVAAPEVQGDVHLTLTNVPWRTALDTVAKSLGFAVVEEDFGILQVVHPSKLKEQLESRFFQLRYARPPGAYRPKIDTEYAVGEPQAPTEDPEQDFSLLRALRSTLTDHGTLEYIQHHNAIIVKDTPPVIAEIGRLIEELDREPAQVFVDVKFVTTSNTDALSYGVDIGDNGIGASISGSAIPSRLPFNIGSDGWGVLPGQTDQQAGGGAGSGSNGIPGLTPAELKTATTFGTLDFTQMNFTLKLLKQDQQTRIVQAPKLIALDHQEATIFVGRTIRYAQTEAAEGQSGGLTFTIREADNSPVQTGFQLYMKPHVIPGTNKVMMEVIPEAEQLVGRSTDPNVPAGFDLFTSGSGATAASIALPQIASRTLVTSMILESGHTAVIGGLITESDTERINKVPVLGDIPLLNFFFRHTEHTKMRESLVIFITPRIIRDADTIERMVREEDERRRSTIEAEVERIFGEGAPDSDR